MNTALPKISAVVFDFDGVILDSARIKTDAFVEVYAGIADPSQLNAIREYHLANQGVSRFVKFPWIAENILGVQIGEEEVQQLGNKFSGMVLRQVLAAPFITGAREFLQFLKLQQIPAFVASGTPETELRNIVQQRELKQYFEGVYGTPKSKSKIIRMVMDSCSYPSERILMIGDASTDHHAALEMKTHFLGIWSEEMNSYWNDTDAQVAKDLTNIENRFEFS